MKLVEMTIKEAREICGENTKVLVAVQDLEDAQSEVAFVPKYQNEYDQIFQDVQTVASYIDDFVKQLRCFTEKQDIYDIKPKGVQKFVLIR